MHHVFLRSKYEVELERGIFVGRGFAGFDHWEIVCTQKCPSPVLNTFRFIYFLVSFNRFIIQ